MIHASICSHNFCYYFCKTMQCSRDHLLLPIHFVKMGVLFSCCLFCFCTRAQGFFKILTQNIQSILNGSISDIQMSIEESCSPEWQILQTKNFSSHTLVQIRGSWVRFPLRSIRFFNLSMSVCDEKLFVRCLLTLCLQPHRSLMVIG